VLAARDVTGAAPETQGRGVGGDQSPAAPSWNETIGVGALDEPVVERRNGRRGQLGAGFGEGLFGDMMHKLGLLLEVGEEFAELSLDALAHTAEHDGDQRWQRQLASADEDVASVGVAGQVAKLRRVQEQGKRGEQRR
jgi:hypothetical protein